MRQRVAIAIALSCEPRLLIADEPTTALDVTVQAQILDLLAREQQRRHMALVLITHDLGVVAGHADEVAVMYAGRIVERAPTRALFKAMRMPYTEALLAAIPRVDAAPHTPLAAISGRPPDMTRLPAGCAFAPRCRHASERCARERPPLRDEPGHAFACWHPIGAAAGGAGVNAAAAGAGPRRAAAARRRGPGGRVRRRPPDRARGVGRELRDRARRDAGPGRRERLRQVIAGARGAAPDRFAFGTGALRRPGHHRTARRGAAAHSQPHADGVPGSDRVAQSAPAHRRHHRRAAGDRRGEPIAPSASAASAP